jgi:hypothetical protein
MKKQNGTAVAVKKNGSGRSVALVEIAKPKVVPDGAPSISDSLPDIVSLGRCTFEDAPRGELATVCDAFGVDRALDRRLETVTEEDVVGHRAYRVAAPRAALVKSYANAAHAMLLAEELEYEGQRRDRNIELVCMHFYDRPNCLQEPPRRPTSEDKAQLTDEARARAMQAWGDATEDEAAGKYAPLNIDRFRETSAEVVMLEAVMHRQPSGTGHLWVRDHKGWLWPFCIVSRRALWRAEEPSTTYTIEDWRARTNHQRGIV